MHILDGVLLHVGHAHHWRSRLEHRQALQVLEPTERIALSPRDH